MHRGAKVLMMVTIAALGLAVPRHVGAQAAPVIPASAAGLAGSGGEGAAGGAGPATTGGETSGRGASRAPETITVGENAGGIAMVSVMSGGSGSGGSRGGSGNAGMGGGPGGGQSGSSGAPGTITVGGNRGGIAMVSVMSSGNVSDGADGP